MTLKHLQGRDRAGVHDMLLRQLGDECQDCGHSRSQHDVDGSLGACTRFGCNCRAYTVITNQRKITLGEQRWVVHEERILFRQHRGWEDEEEWEDDEEQEKVMKYRKKPVVIEAFQMTRERRVDNRDWPNWLNEAWNKDHSEPGAVFPAVAGTGDGELVIHTLEGDHRVDFDDWIIQGVKGELYPCKPDIFAATYDPL